VSERVGIGPAQLDPVLVAHDQGWSAVSADWR
jgi:hypothetical protein